MTPDEADAYLVVRLGPGWAARVDDPDDPCNKCGSLPEERCANAHEQGGLCSRPLRVRA